MTLEPVLVFEAHAHRLLNSQDDGQLVSGFLHVIAWANLNHPVNHLAQAQARVVRPTLRQIIDQVKSAEMPPDRALRLLDDLPEVGFATATKLLTFLSPDRFCVLDRQVAEWLSEPWPFDWGNTTLASTAGNRALYLRWLDFCRRVADELNRLEIPVAYAKAAGSPRPSRWRPVDVERAVFAAQHEPGCSTIPGAGEATAPD
jgi:hypothetical protein